VIIQSFLGRQAEAGGLLLVKPLDTARNNSTTLQNDPDLLVALEASKTYRLWLVLMGMSDQAFNLKLKLTYSGTLTGYVDYRYSANSRPVTAMQDGEMWLWVQSGASINSGTNRALLNGSSTPFTDTGTVFGEGLIRTSTAGTIGLQWAQNATGNNHSTVKARSTLYLEPLT